jgi:hAT family C-terminal dimerisation region
MTRYDMSSTFYNLATNQDMFPTLISMICDIFIILVSMIASEFCFSVANLVLIDKRTRLSEKVFEAPILLKKIVRC